MDDKIRVYLDDYEIKEYIVYELNGEKMVDFILYKNDERAVLTGKIVEDGE